MNIVEIGHGRSPEGKRWAAKIDDCDVVIRMWDWYQWQGTEDYGDRYDYGVFATLPVSLEAFRKGNKMNPDEGWLAYARSTVNGVLPPHTEIIDQRYRDIALQLRGHRGPMNLTRGCAAACWAIEHGDETILVGFDNLKAEICLPTEEAFPEGYLAHYDATYPQWRKNWYYPGSSRCGSHDLSVEKVLLDVLAKRNGVELKFAEDVW